MNDKDRIKKLQERVKQLEKLQTQKQDGHLLLPECDNLCRKVFENANDGIIIHDSAGRIYGVNKALYRRLGYTREEMQQMNLHDLVAYGHGKKIEGRMSRLEQDGVAIFESADLRKDGTAMPVEVSARIIDNDGQKLILSIVRDISERKLAEDLISASLREKEILAEEVERTTQFNNLVLLYILDEMDFSLRKSKDILKDKLKFSRSRILMLLSTQDRLFRSPSYAEIDLSAVLRSLIKHIYALQVSGIKDIVIKQETQNVHMDLHRALPCCLLISELLSNTLRHAFPEERKGMVLVSVSQDETGRYTLILKDDGVGLPDGLNYRRSSTLGFKLVMDLVKQLEGTITLRRSQGSHFTIRFV